LKVVRLWAKLASRRIVFEAWPWAVAAIILGFWFAAPAG
jgi:hypothetical protein